ncbi:MAG: ABC transporter permease subunit [Alphaproteobacteria bacterium]|nr:ABC transporter permease subunit [Alphaproteobacteria bacterium]
MQWDWLIEYAPKLVEGLWLTLQLLVLSIIFGMALAIPIGLVQVTGPRPLAWAAKAFCTTIRGTPLLIQLWLIYYGVGSLFPFIPGIRESFLWPVLRDAFPYALFAFSLSVAGYEGEVMRGAFRGVPKGELEAARAMGMRPFTILWRIWLPRALQNVFPTLAGEFILTLKATPLAATITIFEVYGVTTIVRQETYRIYEPLLFLAFIYLCLTGVLVVTFRYFENRIPKRRV